MEANIELIASSVWQLKSFYECAAYRLAEKEDRDLYCTDHRGSGTANNKMTYL